ncbi:MAG: hypothetical protein RL563_2572, partial [Pseudomonadota bacterium]
AADTTTGLVRISPRQSFGIWEKSRERRSDSWNHHQRETARCLGHSILHVSLQIRDFDTQVKLKESEHRLKLAVSSGQLGIWEYDIPSQTLYWDETMFRLYGVEPETFSGDYSEWSKRLHPDDRAFVESALTQSIQGKEDYDQSFRIIRDDGSIGYVKAHAKVIRGKQGQPVRLIGTHWDNSEYANTKQQLELAYYALESSSTPFYWINVAGQIIKCNAAACRSLGYSLEELRAKSVWEIDPLLTAAAWPSLWAKIKAAVEFRLESQLRQKDGTCFPVEVNARMLKLDDEEFSFAEVRDLRESEQHEQLLRQHRAIIESTDDAIISKNLQGIVQSWNRGAQHLFGYSAEEMIGQSISILFPADSRNEDEELLRAITQGKKVSHFETVRRHKDGHDIDVSVTLSPIRNQHNLVVSVAKIARDISARKVLERALQQEMQTDKAKLAAALSSMNDAVLIADTQGRFIHFNDAFVHYYRFSGREDCAEHFEAYPELFTLRRADGSELSKEQWPIACALKGETAVNLELTVEHKWSGESWIGNYCYSPIFDRNHTLIGGVSTARDITQSHHLEQALKQAQERADAANVAKTAFLANMSHEIRTPMSAIIGMTDLLKEGGSLNPDQQEKLKVIAVASEHLLTLINDILDLSKVEAAKLELEKQEFDLSEVIDRLNLLMGLRASNKGLELRIDVAALPYRLVGDAMRLSQMLLNFLSNAIKFTEQGYVRLAMKIIEETASEVLLHFAVEDSGIGLSSEAQSRLFQAFQQGELSTSRRFGGTGLGLAITRHLALLMHGEVGAECNPEGGSLFWCRVKLDKGGLFSLTDTNSEPVCQPSDKSLLRDRHGGRRILIADDDEFNRMLAEQQLKGSGLEITFAENGKQALELAKQHQFDLILMDMQMPQLDGLDATRAIRLIPTYADTPIIAMTANAFAEDRRNCIDAGMDDYLSKPVNVDMLHSILLKWLDKWQGLSKKRISCVHEA